MPRKSCHEAANLKTNTEQSETAFRQAYYKFKKQLRQNQRQTESKLKASPKG